MFHLNRKDRMLQGVSSPCVSIAVDDKRRKFVKGKNVLCDVCLCVTW